MGIKFRCPNGHKLNVKSFLAGKRGVCPKCGTSLQIPLESQLEKSGDAGDEPEEAEGEDLLSEACFPAPGRASAGANGRGTVTASPSLPTTSAATTARPIASVVPTAIPIAAAPGVDPIAESPSAIWYVRPPGGDQYGPARGDIMRRWIAEGRVSSDSLVWREGWTDWQNAAQVFPSLLPAAPHPPPAPSSTATLPKQEPPTKDEPATPLPRSARLTNRYESRKKQGSGLGVAVIVFLGLLCVVLAVLLAYVFLVANNDGSKTPKAQSRASQAARVYSVG